jgi:putative transposase
MVTKPTPESGSADTDPRIDAKSPTTIPLNDTAEMVAAALVADATGHHGRSRFFKDESDGSDDVLDGFVADVTTIAQSQCERWENYADIETLICHLPIDHLTFAAHDASAPYLGPYPMALLVRAFIIEEINGWDEAALHDHLRAHPSLRQNLGFETLPNQSTFWRAWNERFSEDLRDAVQECADAIVMAARACGVPLPDWIGTDGADGSEADDPPKHQLVAEKTDEVWQQAKPFVTDAFALDRGQNWEIHENAFWEQHAYMGMREDMYMPGAAPPRSRSILHANGFLRDRPTATRSGSSPSRRFGRCCETPHEC